MFWLPPESACPRPFLCHVVLCCVEVGGPWPGEPNASTVFPVYHYVDYVRVVQKVHSWTVWKLRLQNETHMIKVLFFVMYLVSWLISVWDFVLIRTLYQIVTWRHEKSKNMHSGVLKCKISSLTCYTRQAIHVIWYYTRNIREFTPHY